MSRLYRLTLTLAAALVMLAPVAANAQTADDGLRLSDREPAVGVRLSAMAGAGGIAGIGDFGALFANPAGLGYQDGSYLSGALTNGITCDAVWFVSPGVSTRADE